MRKIILQTLLLCSATIVNAEEPILGGPCQGCEFVFQDMPKEILPTAILVPSNTVGEPMIVSGTVYNNDGTVAPDIII